MMRLRSSLVTVGLLMASVVLSGCANVSHAAETPVGPAKLVAVENSDIPRVVLTGKAVRRLGIQFAAVEADGSGPGHPVRVESKYDADGKTWAYVSPKPLTFERAPITVTTIADDKAYLSEGPVVGTQVMTIGMAELYGVEQAIGY